VTDELIETLQYLCVATEAERMKYSQLWCETDGLITAFVAVREQERKWWNNENKRTVASSSREGLD
jgi:hypothetical protein